LAQEIIRCYFRADHHTQQVQFGFAITCPACKNEVFTAKVGENSVLGRFARTDSGWQWAPAYTHGSQLLYRQKDTRNPMVICQNCGTMIAILLGTAEEIVNRLESWVKQLIRGRNYRERKNASKSQTTLVT